MGTPFYLARILTLVKRSGLETKDLQEDAPQVHYNRPQSRNPDRASPVLRRSASLPNAEHDKRRVSNNGGAKARSREQTAALRGAIGGGTKCFDKSQAKHPPERFVNLGRESGRMEGSREGWMVW